MNFADHIIVANDLWMKKIINRDHILPEKCTAILNYPIMKYYQKLSLKHTGEGFTLIYPGTLSYIHGTDIAIKAMAIIKEKLQNVVLKIYGYAVNITYYNSIVNMVDVLKLNEHVKLYDPVIGEELKKIFEYVDVGIVTKRSGIFAEEAFSSKIFDYMAVGIPIVASRTKIDEYYFNDSMIMFFEPGNHEDLANCIIEILNNPSKRKSLVEVNSKYIKKNTWEKKSEIYTEIVNDLIN